MAARRGWLAVSPKQSRQAQTVTPSVPIVEAIVLCARRVAAGERTTPISLQAARLRRRRLRGCRGRSRVLGESQLDIATQALTYTVDGDEPPIGGSLAGADGAEPVLAFSDGTRVQLALHAHGRVVDLNRHGARIALDDGKATSRSRTDPEPSGSSRQAPSPSPFTERRSRSDGTLGARASASRCTAGSSR